MFKVSSFHKRTFKGFYTFFSRWLTWQHESSDFHTKTCAIVFVKSLQRSKSIN